MKVRVIDQLIDCCHKIEFNSTIRGSIKAELNLIIVFQVFIKQPHICHFSLISQKRSTPSCWSYTLLCHIHYVTICDSVKTRPDLILYVCKAKVKIPLQLLACAFNQSNNRTVIKHLNFIYEHNLWFLCMCIDRCLTSPKPEARP